MQKNLFHQNIVSSIPSLLFLFIGMAMFFAMAFLGFGFALDQFSMGIIFSIIFVLMTWGFAKIEKIPLSSLNIVPDEQSSKKLLSGLFIGLMISLTMIFLVVFFGGLELEITNEPKVLVFLLSSLVFVPLALMEELLFRGYPFFRLSKLLNIRFAIIFTSVLFGLYHFNGNQSLWSLMLGPGVWGIIYATSAYQSNSIAKPLGIHIAANFSLALFGFKPNHNSIWDITAVGEMTEMWGIIMQLCLLIGGLIYMEKVIKNKLEVQN